MGQHKAVATMLGVRLRGFPAWFAARTYHVAMMPGVARRLRLVTDWTVGLLFGRAAAELGQLGHPPSPRQPARGPSGGGGRTGERRDAPSGKGASSRSRASFELAARSLREAVGAERALVSRGPRTEADSWRMEWPRQRPLLEFIAAQPGSGFWVCEERRRARGLRARGALHRHGRAHRDLPCPPSTAGAGIGRGLLERCWPESPTRERGRVVVTLGTPADLTLYTRFGVMPVAGHWHLRLRADEYLERRSLEATDATEPAVHVLTADRAVEEWKRLEPAAIGHKRPGAARVLRPHARLPRRGGRRRRGEGRSAGSVPTATSARPWASTPEDLMPVVLAALDRVAKSQEPELLGVYCTTDSWWLLDRLRRLGFRLHWPSWVMSSVPLPGLDRYLPTRPARLL